MFKVLKSPRTVSCNLCLNQIVKGSMRLTANLGTGNYPKHYHLKCFAKTFKTELEQILKETKCWSVS